MLDLQRLRAGWKEVPSFFRTGLVLIAVAGSVDALAHASATPGSAGFTIPEQVGHLAILIGLLYRPGHGVMHPGGKITHGFDKPGTYRYDCSFHPNNMQGTVIVTSG